MELVLARIYYNHGTNGMLFYRGHFQCYTIEMPWLENQHGHSCIPEGRYRLLIRYSVMHGVHFILEDVKDSALILMYPANDALQALKGSIVPVTRITGEGKGAESMAAFEKLKKTCH